MNISILGQGHVSTANPVTGNASRWESWSTEEEHPRFLRVCRRVYIRHLRNQSYPNLASQHDLVSCINNKYTKLLAAVIPS